MAEEHTGDETGIDERLQRIRQVVQDSIERRARGEILSDQSLIEAHPDLVPELGEELRRVGVDQMAKRQADLTVDRPARTPQQDAPTRHRQETATADGRAIPPLGAIRSFGAYELLEEIERGGMGVVYKARQVSPKRIVAIKMILAGQLASDSDVQRFHNEAEAAAHLDHPGIVPIYEVGRYEDQHYFSMGYVEGSSLSAKVADGPLPPRKAAEYVRQVAEAVAFAHQYGVIHRDLKPANVLLDRNDEPRVTDFGLAKRVEGDSNLTASGQILGTPSFMPPEQAAGQIDEVAETADIYSLGAILYNLITGRPPFQADNQLDTLLQVLEQEPVSPRQLNRKVPQDLETICLKCMRKDRSRRYCTADELAADLECWLTGVPIKARPVSRTERCWRWCRRNPIGASLLATVAMLLVTLTMATILISQSWNQNKIAFAQRDEQRRQARVSSEESIFLTHVVRQGNAIDNRFSDYEGPLEDLRASVTKTLAQSPTENELVYYANHIDSGQGPMPPDLALSEAHEGKQVSIEHGTVAGLGCDNASETALRRLMTLRHDFRRIFKRTLVLSRQREREPPTDGKLRRILANEGSSVAVPWMYYSREDGIHYAYPGKGGYNPDYDPTQRPFYKPFLAPQRPRGLTWGELYGDEHGLGLLLPCCTAIYDARDNVLGIVGFDVRMGPIREMLKIDLSYFVKAYLVDADWMVIVDSDMTGSETSGDARPFEFAALVKETKAGGSWLVKTDSLPPKYLAVFPLHVKGWHYVVEADSDRLTRRAQQE